MAENIYTSRKLKRSFFGFKVERPQAAPGKVLVLTGGGAPIVLRPGEKPTTGEAAWNRYDTVIEIDAGRRDFTFTAPVSAKEGDVSFQMTFSASYQVSDPVRVLNEGLMNPEPALRRIITESVSRVTENYAIEDAPGAVKAVREVIDKNKYNEKLPFDLSAINIKLDLDGRARDFLAQLRDQRRAAELAAGKKQFTEEQAKIDKLGRQHELDMQQVQSKHDLDLEKQRTLAQLELERQKAQSALEIQQMRIEVYKPMIQGGLWDMMLLRLAENPGDIDQVSELITQMHAQQLAADVAVLEAMIRGDRIGDHHLKDVTSDLVRRLRNMTSGGAPALAAAPEAKQLGTSARQDKHKKKPTVPDNDADEDEVEESKEEEEEAS